MIKAKYLTKVTDLNKVLLEDVISEGDIVIDATMGNGYDTKYLAEKVGESGVVYSFDVQEEAIKSTRKRLEKRCRFLKSTRSARGRYSRRFKTYVGSILQCQSENNSSRTW